jgi:hypothetical protein
VGSRMDLWALISATAIAVVGLLASTVRSMDRRARQLSVALFAVLWSLCALGVLYAVDVSADEAAAAGWSFVVVGLVVGGFLSTPATATRKASQKNLAVPVFMVQQPLTLRDDVRSPRSSG